MVKHLQIIGNWGIQVVSIDLSLAAGTWYCTPEKNLGAVGI